MAEAEAGAGGTLDTQLRLLLDQLPVVLWAVDRDLRFTMSEGNGLRSLGLQPGQVVGLTLYEFFQTTDPEHESIRRHLQASRGESIEYETCWLDREFQCRLEPRRNERGEIVGCWGCALDVTERRQAERAGRQSELQRQAVTENVPAFLLLIDADGRIHYINRTQPGERREDVIDRTVYDYLPKEIAVELRPKLARLFTTQEPFEYESTSESPVGFVRTYQSRVIPFPSADAPPLALMIATDITEARQAENTIAAQQAKLLHVARLSTMGQMVAAFSHEVTQPLSAIANFAGTCLFLLEQDPQADPRFVRYLTSISEQATRAGSIISTMRAFARRGQLPQVETDLSDLISSGVTLITSEMRSRHIALRVALSPTPLKVRVDPVQIQQVLINIIKNACDAIESVPNATREVQLRSSCEDDRAIIEVIDHGPGLSDEVAANLFSPFFTTKADGMGLGLSICQDIVASHQGTLEARNHVDGGACFRITLPILESSIDGGRNHGTDNLSD